MPCPSTPVGEGEGLEEGRASEFDGLLVGRTVFGFQILIIWPGTSVWGKGTYVVERAACFSPMRGRGAAVGRPVAEKPPLAGHRARTARDSPRLTSPPLRKPRGNLAGDDPKTGLVDRREIQSWVRDGRD